MHRRAHDVVGGPLSGPSSCMHAKRSGELLAALIGLANSRRSGCIDWQSDTSKSIKRLLCSPSQEHVHVVPVSCHLKAKVCILLIRHPKVRTSACRARQHGPARCSPAAAALRERPRGRRHGVPGRPRRCHAAPEAPGRLPWRASRIALWAEHHAPYAPPSRHSSPAELTQASTHRRSRWSWTASTTGSEWRLSLVRLQPSDLHRCHLQRVERPFCLSGSTASSPNQWVTPMHALMLSCWSTTVCTTMMKDIAMVAICQL